MQNCHFINFDITIRGTSAPYSIMAHFAGSVAEGYLDLEATTPGWQSAIAKLGDTNLPPGNQYITESGATLFHALMDGDIQSLWSRARASLNEPGVGGIRLRLALYPPSVAGLPWECLYDPDRRELFAAGRHTPLIRVKNQERYLSTPRSLHTDLPIRVLVACPEDPSDVIDMAKAYQTVNLLQGFGDEFVQVDVMTGRFGLVELSRRLDETGAEILHVISHGESYGLLLWQDEEPAFMPAHTVRVALQRSQNLKLVLLNACLTGESSDRIPFAAVGAQLLQTGIPAVIAMQFEIEDDAAHEFSGFLYEELLTGPCPGAIDVATSTARSNLYLRYPDQMVFGTPVLWMNAHDGQVFTLSETDRDRLPQIRDGLGTITQPAMGRLTPGRLIESVESSDSVSVDTRPYVQWLSQRQAEVDQHAHAESYRLLRFEWERKTNEFSTLLVQLPNGDLFDADVERLQRQISALADAICSNEEVDEERPLIDGM